ncbi:hypothetical protein [Saccharothrix xinjiangensis]|uniref:Uncharacterized protein n=1 Tax=Saccharothrix xinjiangensis TaxID=204798 RepID=A0ABV9Y5B6_9PSEU
MSSLFGQVWLWSLLAFAAGVALTWLIMVRPAKRQLEEMEDRLLIGPRPTSTTGSGMVTTATATATATAVTPAPARDRSSDDWHVEASRSLVDDVPESPRYDAADLKREELLEELDDEHRPLSDFEEGHDFPQLEEDPPRSLFDRMSPQGGDVREPMGAEAARVGSRAGSRDATGRGATGRDVPRDLHGGREVPELPAEETHLLPAVPVAEVEPRRDEPIAPPEVQAFQPREVWREETAIREVYDQDELLSGGREEEDEPERRGSEETALIPATALAEAIAEVDRERGRDAGRDADREEPQAWPEHDLTGHFAPVDVEAERRGPATEILRPVSAAQPMPVVPDVVPDFEPREHRAPEPAAEPEVPPTAPRHGAAPGEPRHAEPRHAEPRHAEPRHTEPRHTEPRHTGTWSGDIRSGDVRDGEDREVDDRPGDDYPTEIRPTEFRPGEPEPFEPAFVEPTPTEPEPFVPTFVEQTTPEPAPKPTPAPPAAKPTPASKEEPARPRSLFEPLVTLEGESEPEPEPEASRPTPPVSDDQPFVPKLAPELLAANGDDQGAETSVPAAGGTTGAGLPQRSARRSGDRRTSPPPPPAPTSAPKSTTPAAARPVRPRPVGFSPSTGGRPASGSTRYRGQEEGFNPRSPFGPGSVLPKSDGLAPAPEFQVKATLTGRRYFTSESANFRETRADVWFRTTSDAEKAGFHQAP